MKKELDLVENFHRAFNAPIAYEPTIPPKDRLKLRCKLILEEALEFIHACGLGVEVRCGPGDTIDVDMDTVRICTLGNKPNFIEMCDAIKDIQVVTHGTEIEMGIQAIAQTLFFEVMRSNMSKLGADGKPIYREDGKVLKGPDYYKPDLARHFTAFRLKVPT